MLTAAGPMSTASSVGKMHNISGMSIFKAILAACSSARMRLRVRSVSDSTRSESNHEVGS